MSIRDYITSKLEREPVAGMAFNASILLNALKHTILTEQGRKLDPSEGAFGDALRALTTFRKVSARQRETTALGRMFVGTYCRTQQLYVYDLIRQISDLRIDIKHRFRSINLRGHHTAGPVVVSIFSGRK